MSFKTYKLEDLLEVQNGYAFNSKQFSTEGEIGLIRIRDLKRGIGTETKYSGEYDKKYVVKTGDFLIGMDGEFSCYEWKGEDSLLNQRVCRLKNFSDSLYPRYLFYGINKYLKDIEDVTGFTTVKHISAKQIKQIEFPLPPPPEQKRIVAILDESFAGIDQAIANTEKNLASARELFESYMGDLFKVNRENWPQNKFKEICSFVRGPFGGSLKKSCFVEDGVAVYEQQHAINNQFENIRYFIDDEKFQEMRRFELLPNDLIMSCSGTMGKVAIVPSNARRGIINQALLKLTPNKNILSEFLKLWMESDDFQDQLKLHTKGVAIKNVASVKVLKEIEVPLPRIEEQQKIIEKLQSNYAETEKLAESYKTKLNLLNELKQSLLQKAFSGELTADLTDEIAEAAE